MLVLRLCGDDVPKSWNRWGRPLSRESHRIWAFPLPETMDRAELVHALVQETPAESLADCLAVWIQPDFDGRLPLSVLDELEPLSVLHTRLHEPWIMEELGPRVRARFQAIAALSEPGGLLGYQMRCGLDHPRRGLLSADELYRLGRAARRLDALDQACQISALVRKAEVLPRGVPVFIAALPHSLLHRDPHRHPSYACVERLGLDPADIVIEVAQRGAVDDIEMLIRRCAQLRQMGFRVALSEVGAGFGQIGVIAGLEPEFVRLDPDLLREARASAAGASLFEGLVATARRLGAATVADGVQTRADLRLYRELGVDYGQGDLIAGCAPVPEAPAEMSAIDPRDPAHGAGGPSGGQATCHSHRPVRTMSDPGDDRGGPAR
ncbi:EAL domain-containing protein [Thioalkalivibrio paradoxus]|uniref:EAL domain-containing protein n=1 Tax=Thioalkalivibrio paradoxus ARh 1 TaxID=713585 RepID=W0DSS9_9GAMM|nr:EAL domain-containing protein [Thioalkalivibrio paradoxus]AHE99920.1 hypothetical protein THITH_03785 [Thioalkalivibrio paradoxus ARh 1]